MSGSPIPINAPATGGPRRLRRWQHEALLYGGRAVLGDEPLVPEAEENDFLGIPGLLSPEQVAVLLKQREAEIASTATRRREPGDEVDDPVAVHRLTAGLRREINGLVARVARRPGSLMPLCTLGCAVGCPAHRRRGPRSRPFGPAATTCWVRSAPAEAYAVDLASRAVFRARHSERAEGVERERW